MLLLESENISWWRPSWNLAAIMNLYLWMNLTYFKLDIRIYFYANVWDYQFVYAASSNSKKIMKNCCHFLFWRPFFISKTCFSRFYYLLQSHLLPCNILCFAKKVYWFYSGSICIKMRFWGPFWIAIIIFSPRMPKWHSADSY